MEIPLVPDFVGNYDSPDPKKVFFVRLIGLFLRFLPEKDERIGHHEGFEEVLKVKKHHFVAGHKKQYLANCSIDKKNNHYLANMPAHAKDEHKNVLLSFTMFAVGPDRDMIFENLWMR